MITELIPHLLESQIDFNVSFGASTGRRALLRIKYPFKDHFDELMGVKFSKFADPQFEQGYTHVAIVEY